MIHAVESSSVRSPSSHIHGSALSAAYNGGYRQGFVPVVPSQSPDRMDVSYSSDVGRDQRLRQHEELLRPYRRESEIAEQCHGTHTERHERSQGALSSSDSLSVPGCSFLNHPVTSKSPKRSPGIEQGNRLHSKRFSTGQSLQGSYTIPTIASSRTSAQPDHGPKAPQRLSLDLNGPVLLHKPDNPLWSASTSAKGPGENSLAYATSLTGRLRGQTVTSNFPSVRVAHDMSRVQSADTDEFLSSLQQLNASQLWSSSTRVHHCGSTRDASSDSASISTLPSTSCLDPRKCRGVADVAKSSPPLLMRPRAITEVAGTSAHSMDRLEAPVKLTARTHDWLHGSPSAAGDERVVKTGRMQTEAGSNSSQYDKSAAEGRISDNNHNDDVALRHPTSKALSLLPPPSIDAARWLIKGDEESSKRAEEDEDKKSAEMSEDSNGSNRGDAGDHTLAR